MPNAPFLEDFEKPRVTPEDRAEFEALKADGAFEAPSELAIEESTPSLKMTKTELTAIAEERGVEVSDVMTKAEILEAIEK